MICVHGQFAIHHVQFARTDHFTLALIARLLRQTVVEENMPIITHSGKPKRRRHGETREHQHTPTGGFWITFESVCRSYSSSGNERMPSRQFSDWLGIRGNEGYHRIELHLPSLRHGIKGSIQLIPNRWSTGFTPTRGFAAFCTTTTAICNKKLAETETRPRMIYEFTR